MASGSRSSSPYGAKHLPRQEVAFHPSRAVQSPALDEFVETGEREPLVVNRAAGQRRAKTPRNRGNLSPELALKVTEPRRRRLVGGGGSPGRTRLLTAGFPDGQGKYREFARVRWFGAGSGRGIWRDTRGLRGVSLKPGTGNRSAESRELGLSRDCHPSSSTVRTGAHTGDCQTVESSDIEPNSGLVLPLRCDRRQ